MVSSPSVQWQIFRDIHSVPESITHFLINSEHGSVLQFPPWHVYTATRPSRYMVVAATAGNTPVFGALVHKSPLPGLGAFKGTIERGPVFDDEDLAMNLWEDFENLMKEGLCALDVQPFWKREQLSRLKSFLESRDYAKSPESTSHTETLTVDLHRPEEEIFKTMKGSRNRIRKAISLGVEVRSVQGSEEMKSFWMMYRDMCRSKGLRYWSCGLFERIRRFASAYPQDCVCLLGWLNHLLIGGYVLLRHGDIVEITRGGASPTIEPQIPKTDLIFWEAIRWSKLSGAAICDLGGITPDAAKGSAEWNVNRFKRKFSDQQVSLFEPMQKIFNPHLHVLHGAIKRLKNRVAQYTN